jgi:hypothetical protein
MKYVAIVGVLMFVNVLSGAIDPCTYEDSRHSQAKQIVKLTQPLPAEAGRL